MKYTTLNNGLKMPILGFGVYQIPDFDECKKSVLLALKAGYRMIDTAAGYGNEAAVGQAIKESGIPREDIFVTTKLWISDNGYEKTLKAIDTSLNKLDSGYIDLYLIHQPYGDVHGSWRAMEESYESGTLKAIGVSNFHPDRVMDLMVNNKVKPALNQIETHPFFQRWDNSEFLENNDIQMESWAPFAEGKHNMFTNEVLKKIGNKYGKSVAQVTVKWMIQRNIVVIPKSVNKSRIEENINVFDFELSDDDMDAIKNMDLNESSFFSHRDPEIIKWFSTMIK